MKSALDAEIGLPRSSTNVLRIVGLLIPAAVRRSFIISFFSCVVASGCKIHANSIANTKPGNFQILSINLKVIRFPFPLIFKLSIDLNNITMRKLIAAINMSLDGFCDHTAMDADDEIHEHYNDLLRKADTLIYGRITYQLMESY